MRRAGPLLWILVPIVLASAVLARPSTAQTPAVHRTRDLAIPMSAGGELLGDLYRPAVDGVPLNDLPTVVVYFPYRKDDSTRFEREAMDAFARAGFAGLLVDIRGTGRSPGEFGMVSEREVRDGYDVVEWAARQPWSNGNVGMWGYSYPGVTAAMVAALRPPHLRAIVPASSFNDPYRDLFYPGGITASQDSGLAAWLAFHAMVRPGPDTPADAALLDTADALAGPGGLVPVVQGATRTLYDDFWRERTLRAARIRVPSLFWSGWHDVYPRGTVINHRVALSRHNRLVLGPWGHLGGASGAPLEFLIRDSIRWFDIWLRTPGARERDRKLAGIPPVRVFDVDPSGTVSYEGWPGEWRALRSWPPPGPGRAFELCAPAGPPSAEAPWPSRSALLPACEQSGSVIVPGAPVELTGGASVVHDGAPSNDLNDPKDQRLNPATAVFVGPALRAPLPVSGPMVAELWATTVGTDADWAVRVVDIGPEATRVIAQGWLRASHRALAAGPARVWHPHDREDPVVPEEPYRMVIEIWPASYRIPAGHRVGLLVQAADTMKVLGRPSSVVSSVLFGPDHPSRLIVPVRADRGRPVSVLPA